MNPPATFDLLKGELEDILGDLHFARRNEDLGRLALVTYWEVRRWALVANRELLAEHAARAIRAHPHDTRGEFLKVIDGVIEELEDILGQLPRPALPDPAYPMCRAGVGQTSTA